MWIKLLITAVIANDFPEVSRTPSRPVELDEFELTIVRLLTLMTHKNKQGGDVPVR